LKLKDEHQMAVINRIYLVRGRMKDRDGKKAFLLNEEKSTIVPHPAEFSQLFK